MNYIQVAKYIKEKYLIPLENHEIKNLQDVINLHEKLISIRNELKFIIDVMPHYRGEQNYSWDILPGIFRDKIEKNKAREIEKNLVEIFKKKVIENYGQELIFKHSIKPYGEDWDLLFQAQHAGVKTNLIDLSTRIEFSSFFMCEPSVEHDKSDGQLWCLLVPAEFIFNETSDYGKRIYPQLNPFDLKESFVCNIPSYLDNIEERTYQFRLFRQHGRLFSSNNADIDVPLNKKEFWKDMMFRVRVPSEVKKTIFKELTGIGIDKQKLMITESEKGQQIIEEINNVF